MADQLFKKAKVSRQKRIANIQKERSETWLFVCEGARTEPNYIKSLINYANKITKESPLKLKIEGVGRNTESLVKSVEDFYDGVDLYKAQKKGILYAKTFVVFDKDSFSHQQFNTAIQMAEQRGYIPLWSNECFELWFLLHFIYYDANNGRDAYFSCLSELLGIKYEKAGDIFQRIHTSERLKNAMTYSKKLNKRTCCEKSAAKRVPCTQVFRLIEEINEILKIDLTQQQIE